VQFCVLLITFGFLEVNLQADFNFLGFLWIAVSIGTELSIINTVTSKDNEDNFYNLKLLLAKRVEKNFKSNKEIEKHRMNIFLYIYVLITKVIIKNVLTERSLYYWIGTSGRLSSSLYLLCHLH
jgi:hypothetical protein